MIEANHPRLSVVRQCELVSIARSSHYYAGKGESALNLKLMRLIDEQFLTTPWYGSRQGYGVGRKRIRRLMRQMGLTPIYRRPRTSRPHPAHRIYPYLLRHVRIDRPTFPLPTPPPDLLQEQGEVQTPTRPAAKALDHVPTLLGDLSHDGEVSPVDATMLFGFVLAPETGLGLYGWLGDIDQDGDLDWVDIGLLGQWLTDGLPAKNAFGIGQVVELQQSVALVEPSPAFSFFENDGTWHTFEVATTLDSVRVIVNGPETDVALEIAAGRLPPKRSYCGPEASDEPYRPRKNGYKLHLAGCQPGKTEVVLEDFERPESGSIPTR